MRRDHRADVAAVEHGAGRLRGKIALKSQQSGANLRDRRDDGCGLADALGFERLVELRRVKRFGGGRGAGHVVKRMAAVEHGAATAR